MGATRSIGKQETAAVKLPVNLLNTADSRPCAHEWSVCGNYASQLQSMETSELPFIDCPCKNRTWGSSCDLSSTGSLKWYSPFGRQSETLSTGMDLRTYAWAQPASPCGCGWTRASRSRQNPRQILQSLQTLPRERMSRGARAHASSGCRCLSGRWVCAQDHSGHSSVSCWCPLALACPVPQCLSSPQATRPPILLSPSGHTAHPGFPTPERRRSPWFWSEVRSNRFPAPLLFFSGRAKEPAATSQHWKSHLKWAVQDEKWKENVQWEKCRGKKKSPIEYG